MDSPFLMDLRLAPVDDEKGDPTWDADGITWSSSSNDEEESVMAIDDSPPASDIGLGPRTQVQVELSDRPHPAVLYKTTDEQKRQDAPNMEAQEKVKIEPLGPFREQSSDSDSSLASIPAMARFKETPVPLPPTVTAASLLSTSVSSQPRRASLPPIAPLGPASTPTPVPLPLTAMRSASVFGQTPSSSAPVASLADLKKPAATSLTRDKSQPTSQDEAHDMSVSRTSFAAAIDFATDGRPYTIYHQPSGQAVSTKGVLIPAGYKLNPDSRFPLVCPVQACRRTFKNLNSLSGHFGASHSNMTFNDVGDGTLIQVGTYKNNWGTSPGIVVQQTSTSRIAPQPLERSEPEARASKRSLEDPDAYPDSKRYAILQTRGHIKVSQLMSDTFRYMSTVQTGSKTPDRPDIIRMLALPKKRNLPKEFLDKHLRAELSLQEYACATAYITGDEVSGSLACHAATGPLARLSKECIVLPRSMRWESNIGGMFSLPHRCVGCTYLALKTGEPDQCELKTEASEADGGEKRPQVRTSSVRPNVPIPRLSQLSRLGPQREQQSFPAPSGRETEQTLAGRRPVRQSVLNRLQLDKDHGSRPPQSKSPSERSSAQPERGTPLLQQGQFGTPDYEMEDWEIAPGRVTSEDSSRNVAYSGAFLTSSTPITISPDICFNVLTVRPGQIYNVPVQKDKLQVFSVASGKVKVTTGGKVVQLGPNGAFPVRPGDECIIENRIYFEAMVHCTTVKDYELA